jgi:hypothetical protein
MTSDRKTTDQKVEEASEESFPAIDAPAWKPAKVGGTGPAQTRQL